VLKGDDDTGANDIVMDPVDSRIIYASMYQRRAHRVLHDGGGPGSGLFKSTDGGETWPASRAASRGPARRIAVDVYKRKPSILYATIEGPMQPGAGAGALAAGPQQAPRPDLDRLLRPGRSTGGRRTGSRGAAGRQPP